MDIEELIKEGYLVRKFSDDNLLYLLNYTEKSTYKGMWIHETIDNNGKVRTDELNLIPEEFREEVDTMIDFLESEYERLYSEIKEEFNENYSYT